MNILFVKLGSIGDVVHTLPALAAVNRALPEAQISWVVERKAAEILRGNPILNRLIEIDTRALRGRQQSLPEKLQTARAQIADLRADKFDVALDFQGLHKSALIAKLSGAKKRIGFDRRSLREPTSRLLLNQTVKIPSRLHIIRKNLFLVEKGLGIKVPNDANDFEFPIALEEKHLSEAENLIERSGRDFAILNPGGGWTTKQWEARRFGVLADEIWRRFGLKSIVTYGPGEEEIAAIAVESSKTRQAIAACLSLKGYFALARRAKIYVGGDTGPTHLAVAAKTPVVGIFGPTEWWRNGSPIEEDLCVERLDIDCRENCHRRSCGNWICLNIEVEAVVRAVDKRLKSKPLGSLQLADGGGSFS